MVTAILKAIKDILFWIAVFFTAVTIILVALPLLGHIEYKTIVSGSMEPEIPVGSLIMISDIKDEDIRVGDTITFATSADITVTHKVVGFDLSKNALITHGVANDEGNNEITPYDSVVGKVIFTIPFIGRPFLLISTMRGKVVAATIIAALYILSVFFEVLGTKSKDEDQNEAQEADCNNDYNEQKPERNIKAKSEEEAPVLGSWLDNML